MKIAIDLSPLQGPHSQRGVGSVIINLVNNLPNKVKKEHLFVFYMEMDKKTEPVLSSLKLSNVNYEVRDKPLAPNYDRLKLPSKFNLLAKVVKKQMSLLRFNIGVKGYDHEDLDVYLHTDQMHAMPNMRGVKKVLIAYDLIPYILERDYLFGYKTARRLGLSRKTSIAAQLSRSTYIYKLKVNTKRANKILAISNQTKADFIKYLGVSKNKISTLYLGVELLSKDSLSISPTKRYVHTSWGYIAKQFSFKDTPFILFLGGADPRRKINDLVTAYNHLRAEGHDLQLVFSGDILQGPKNIPVKISREALMSSSYDKDIVYLGFTDSAVRSWLFKNALAFVYPSNYEGFGLPVLEAMSFGTPVITYSNSSIKEIGGDAALYADNALSIKLCLDNLIKDRSLREKYSKLGKNRAAKFLWTDTAEKLINSITS